MGILVRVQQIDFSQSTNVYGTTISPKIKFTKGFQILLKDFLEGIQSEISPRKNTIFVSDFFVAPYTLVLWEKSISWALGPKCRLRLQKKNSYNTNLFIAEAFILQIPNLLRKSSPEMFIFSLGRWRVLRCSSSQFRESYPHTDAGSYQIDCSII